jgi:CheY-like chemotaxis protein
VRVTLRVLIVDDQAEFRWFAARLLAADGLVVAGEAATGAEAVAAAHLLRPDLVLLDVQLPDAPRYGERIGASGAIGFLAKEQLSAAALRHLAAQR